MSCPHTVDDGTYVLGALSPAERADFERHLGTCAACREAVANLAVLPGLLGRLDPATAMSTTDANWAPPALPDGALERLLSAASRERMASRRQARARRLRLALAACLAAVVLASGVGVAVHLADSPGAGSNVIAESPMVAVAEPMPISAEVGVVAAPGGSRIEMTCWYSTDYEGQWTLRLVVFGRTGGTGDQVGTWTAAAGDKLSVTASTHLPPADIDHVELQRGDHTTLLTWRPPT